MEQTNRQLKKKQADGLSVSILRLSPFFLSLTSFFLRVVLFSEEASVFFVSCDFSLSVYCWLAITTPAFPYCKGKSYKKIMGVMHSSMYKT